MIGTIHHKNRTLIVSQEEETHYSRLSTGLEKSQFVRGILLERLKKVLEVRR